MRNEEARKAKRGRGKGGGGREGGREGKAYSIYAARPASAPPLPLPSPLHSHPEPVRPLKNNRKQMKPNDLSVRLFREKGNRCKNTFHTATRTPIPNHPLLANP